MPGSGSRAAPRRRTQACRRYGWSACRRGADAWPRNSTVSRRCHLPTPSGHRRHRRYRRRRDCPRSSTRCGVWIAVRQGRRVTGATTRSRMYGPLLADRQQVAQMLRGPHAACRAVQDNPQPSFSHRGALVDPEMRDLRAPGAVSPWFGNGKPTTRLASSPCSDQRDHALVALSVRIGCVCIDRRTPRRSMLYPNRPRFRI